MLGSTGFQEVVQIRVKVSLWFHCLNVEVYEAAAAAAVNGPKATRRAGARSPRCHWSLFFFLPFSCCYSASFAADSIKPLPCSVHRRRISARLMINASAVDRVSYIRSNMPLAARSLRVNLV